MNAQTRFFREQPVIRLDEEPERDIRAELETWVHQRIDVAVNDLNLPMQQAIETVLSMLISMIVDIATQMQNERRPAYR